MKEINDLTLPDNLRYAEDHEWVFQEGDTVKMGVSDYAQDQLGDIVYVDLPEAGDRFSRGDEFGAVESVKAVSELYMPISGEIAEANPALEEAPELVNNDPYGDGWIIKIKPDNPEELEGLMSKESYLKMLKGMEE